MFDVSGCGLNLDRFPYGIFYTVIVNTRMKYKCWQFSMARQPRNPENSARTTA